MQNNARGGLGIALPGFLLLTAVILLSNGMYTIPENSVGLVYRFGALQPGLKDPGMHFRMPLITSVSVVDLRLQTDVVTDIPCGTSGGVMIFFERIEVVNKLSKESAWNTIKYYGEDYDRTWIFDKIHHEINQFCSQHTLQEVYIEKFDILDESLTKALQQACDQHDVGVQIITARVTKPRIPQRIRVNYEKMEEQKTRLRVVEEEGKVVEREEQALSSRARIAALREKDVASIQATREADVARINVDRELSISRTRAEQHIAEKEGAAKVADIENSMLLKKEKSLADAIEYSIRGEAEAMARKLTPSFLLYTLFTSLTNNTRFVYGTEIPDTVIAQSDPLLSHFVGTKK